MAESELTNMTGTKFDQMKAKYHLIPMDIVHELYMDRSITSIPPSVKTISEKIRNKTSLADEFTFCVKALGGFNSAMNLLADVYTYGAKIHGDYNWKHLENGKDRFYSALMRHIRDWKMGMLMNEEDGGLAVLAQVMFNIIAVTYYGEKEDADTK